MADGIAYFHDTAPPPFAPSAHVKYFLALLRSLPTPYSSLDTNRMTVCYFCVSGLDLLGALDQIEDKASLIAWVYAHQLTAPDAGATAAWMGGFRGSFLIGRDFSQTGTSSTSAYDVGHLAMTYTALCTLAILGDDLSRVDRAATMRHVRGLQQPDGSFCAVEGGECDMRFVYCAVAICAFLKDGGGAGEDLGEPGSSDEWEGLDAQKAAGYIFASQSYEGALGLGPGAEAHGGSTYAASAEAPESALLCIPSPAARVSHCCRLSRSHAPFDMPMPHAPSAPCARPVSPCRPLLRALRCPTLSPDDCPRLLLVLAPAGTLGLRPSHFLGTWTIYPTARRQSAGV